MVKKDKFTCMKKTLIILLTSLTVVTIPVACHKNAVTGKSSLTLIPESELIGMSVQEYGQFLSQNPPLPASDARVAMVKRCGARIQKAVEDFHAQKNAKADLEGFNWEFNV